MASVSTAGSPRVRAVPRIGVRGAAALMIAVQLGFWALMTLPGYFRVDDFIYFGLVQHDFTSLSQWLGSVQYQHFAPGHRLVFWVLHSPTPGHYLILELAELAVLGLGLACFYGTLELLFGRSWWLLIPLAVAGFAYPLVLPLVWPSAGLQCIPSFGLGCLCVYAYVRRAAGGGRAWGALTVAALALTLCFYIRGLLLVGVLALIEILFLSPSLHPREVVLRFWSRRFTWAGLIAVAVAYVLIYRSKNAFGQYQPFKSSDLVTYLRIVWFRNLVPGLMGIEIGNYAHLPAWKRGVELIGQLLIVAAFVWSIRLKRSAALRGWAYVALVAGATFLLTAAGRLGTEGSNIGFDMRYVTDLFWQLPLGVVFALHPRRHLQPGEPWPETAPRMPLRLRPFVVPAAVLATLAVSAFAMHAANYRKDVWMGPRARTWAVNVQDSLRRLNATGPVPRVVQGNVAPEIILGFGDYSLNSWILPQFGQPVEVESPRGPNAMIEPDGRIHRVHWVPERTVDVLRSKTVAGKVRRVGDHVCLEPSGGAPAVAELPPLNPPVGGARVVMEAVVPGGAPPWARLGVNSGYGWPEVGNRIFAGVGDRGVADTGETSVKGIRIYSPPSAPLCVGRIRLGILVRG